MVYCNFLPPGLLKNFTEKLQRIQNNSARLLFSVLKYDHVPPLLQALHCLVSSFKKNRIQTLLPLPLCNYHSYWSTIITSLTSCTFTSLNSRPPPFLCSSYSTHSILPHAMVDVFFSMRLIETIFAQATPSRRWIADYTHSHRNVPFNKLPP